MSIYYASNNFNFINIPIETSILLIEQNDIYLTLIANNNSTTKLGRIECRTSLHCSAKIK